MQPLFHPRVLQSVLERCLEQFPVVVLSGARQTGKSTLVQHLPSAASRRYLTLDDLDQLALAKADPQGFLARAGSPLALDEVQRVPDLLLAVKASVDRDRHPGRFLLTGSANLLLMARVSESLAGRTAYLELGPMTECEKAGRGPPAFWNLLFETDGPEDLLRRLPPPPDHPSWPRAVLEGGLPPAAWTASGEERARFFDGYVRTYLERDLRQLSAVGDLVDFRRLMKAAALRIGQVLNQANLARDAALAHTTAHGYLNLLETSYQILRLPAFVRSRTKRLVKSPKLYWTDPGLGAFLAGIHDEEALAGSPLAGALLENLVLTQFSPWRETQAPRPELFHWRTVPGLEVDLVLSWKGRLVPVEIKAGARTGPGDLKGLEGFLAEYGRAAPLGVLLCGVREACHLSDRIVALPIETALTP